MSVRRNQDWQVGERIAGGEHDIRQFLHTFIYIANNPVRAGIVNNALDFEYNAITFFSKGMLDLLERPPNRLLKIIWPAVVNFKTKCV